MSSAIDTLRSVLEERGRSRLPEFQHLNASEGALHAVVQNDAARGGCNIAFTLAVPDLTLALKAARYDDFARKRLRSAVEAIEARFDDALEEYIVRRWLPQRVRESAYR